MVQLLDHQMQFEDTFMLSSHFRQRCAILHSYGIIRQWLACEMQSGKGSRTGSNCHSRSTELQVTDNTYALIRKPNVPRSSSVRTGSCFIFRYVIPIVAGTRMGQMSARMRRYETGKLRSDDVNFRRRAINNYPRIRLFVLSN